ncbi:aminotransferase class IV [Demequina zhanjiangensis]|uniref:Aminotransferase class IV n=1 Tax=Demequina zhanjiangensis TaxID=3051659 RepID=A0ABT8G0Y8_9MICO|nr:aminotransferase class IV [Demequina sp. SYSU T00b26]MDN4472752.1 aminotransferase class IV [Demequina sp. SYSU T00b26]
MIPVAWIDGVLQDPDTPAISPLDHGFTVGDGVFETLEVRGGAAFALTRHLRRLEYSADRMALGPIDASLVQRGVEEALEEAGESATRIRITLSSGPGPMSSARGGGPHRIAVIVSDGPAPARCRAVRSPWRRNERSAIAGVKSTSYAENAVMVAYAASKGADEAIMANTHGHLCEGTGTNVFIEKDGEIITPPLASGCLAGITRGLALEWGARSGIPVRVTAPGELDMSVLDEVLRGEAHAAVTSSTRGVQHVEMLDGVELAPGRLMERLRGVYDAAADADLDPVPPRSK